MIPLRDENPSRTFPFISISLIIANFLVFLWQLSNLSIGNEAKVLAYTMVPVEVAHGEDLLPPPSLHPVWLTIFTSMFMHGNWAHLLGNMLYLWIFGDNVEDTLGHLRFLIFYLLCGFLAALAHILSNPNSPIPTLGASGAISGVLGAYFLLFPGAGIVALVPLGYFIQLRIIPAWLVLGFWFLLQLINSQLQQIIGEGGVAYWAHIGGFLAGMILIKLMRAKPRPRVPRYWRLY